MNTGFVLLIIIGIMAIIALISFIIYRVSHPKLKDDKPDEKEIANEELNRILKPIDNEEVAKEIEDYKEKDE